MKTDYKYIQFVKLFDKPKTSVWACLANRSKSEIGLIEWYGPWRQYCFFPFYATVFNTSCLEDIKHFIGQISKSPTSPPAS